MRTFKNILVLGAFLVCLVPATAQNNQEWQTSTMRSSGSAYSSQVTPVGSTTAASEVTTTESTPTNGPRKVKMDGTGLPGNPGTSGGDNTPIGDAMLPMLLMAAAFCGVVTLRRRKSLESEN